MPGMTRFLRALPRPALLTLAAALSVACTPQLDWRDLKPEGLKLSVSMPCRPAGQQRALELAGAHADLSMFSCAEQEMMFGVGGADVGDPGRVGTALDSLVSAMAANLQGRIEHDDAAGVLGMTPHPRARRLRIVGQRPGGVAVIAEMAVFSFGSRVYQAVLLGERIDAESARMFFESLKVAA